MDIYIFGDIVSLFGSLPESAGKLLDVKSSIPTENERSIEKVYAINLHSATCQEAHETEESKQTENGLHQTGRLTKLSAKAVHQSGLWGARP